jgi:hypothetical protein
MAGPIEPTRTAKWFRVLVALGSASLCISAFLPWCRIWGLSYTFFRVDDWKVLPASELGIAAGAVVASLIRLAWIKRIALFLGSTALVLNMVGLFVGAHLANVHNSDPYFRIWAAISVWPELGMWIALLACGLLIVGGLSPWQVCISTRGAAVETGRSLYHESVGKDVHGIPMQP